MKSSILSFLCSSFLDLIYPRMDISDSTTAVDYQHSGLKYVSDENLSRFRIISEVICGVCGSPVVGKDLDEISACQHCSHLKPFFDGNRSVFLLNRVGKQLIHELKYHHGNYLLTDIKQLIAQAKHVEPWIRDSVLVPIPLHPKRLHERGYNQSEWLAKVFGAVWGNDQTHVRNLLRRTQNTTTQTRMDRHQRQRNIKGAFDMDQSAFKGASKAIDITLIDDVFTTGSTINECAKVLKRNGFNTVRSITLGHG